jgi:hypothetical protein
MPKSFAFYSQEAKESLGDETTYYYVLAATGATITATHITEDESGSDYFWKDKQFLGEVSVPAEKPVDFHVDDNTWLYRGLRVPAIDYAMLDNITLHDEIMRNMQNRIAREVEDRELNQIFLDMETNNRR